MKLKFFLFFGLLAVCTEAYQRIPVKVLRLKKTQDPIEPTPTAIPSVQFQDAAILVPATFIGADDVTPETGALVLDSKSSITWIVSKSSESPFAINKVSQKAKTTFSGSGDTVVEKNGKLEGKLCQNCLIMIGADLSGSTNILAADYIDESIMKSIPSESVGVIGLMDNNLFSLAKPEELLYLHIDPSSPKDNGVYTKYPPDVTKKDLMHSNPKYITPLSNDMWKISLDYIRNTRGDWVSWAIGGADAIVDTTYSGISGPKEDIDSINAFLGADDDGHIHCDQVNFLQALSFHIDGTSYLLEAKNYIKKSDRRYEHRCKTVFEVEYTYNDQWRLGLAFMQQFLTVFNVNLKDPKISFVTLKTSK